jgi:hypothetical protein
VRDVLPFPEDGDEDDGLVVDGSLMSGVDIPDPDVYLVAID